LSRPPRVLQSNTTHNHGAQQNTLGDGSTQHTAGDNHGIQINKLGKNAVQTHAGHTHGRQINALGDGSKTTHSGHVHQGGLVFNRSEGVLDSTQTKESYVDQGGSFVNTAKELHSTQQGTNNGFQGNFSQDPLTIHRDGEYQNGQYVEYEGQDALQQAANFQAFKQVCQEMKTSQTSASEKTETAPSQDQSSQEKLPDQALPQESAKQKEAPQRKNKITLNNVTETKEAVTLRSLQSETDYNPQGETRLEGHSYTSSKGPLHVSLQDQAYMGKNQILKSSELDFKQGTNPSYREENGEKVLNQSYFEGHGEGVTKLTVTVGTPDCHDNAVTQGTFRGHNAIHESIHSEQYAPHVADGSGRPLLITREKDSKDKSTHINEGTLTSSPSATPSRSPSQEADPPHTPSLKEPKDFASSQEYEAYLKECYQHEHEASTKDVKKRSSVLKGWLSI